MHDERRLDALESHGRKTACTYARSSSTACLMAFSIGSLLMTYCITESQKSENQNSGGQKHSGERHVRVEPSS